MSFKITNPEFIDLEKTKVKFKLISESGIESQAELTVPPGKQRGLNSYWDYILDNFDIEKMRQARNRKETELRKQTQHALEKRKADEKRTYLKELFNLKTSAFDLPFVESAPTEVKAAIRRAPTKEVLTFILHDVTRKFMEENNMSYVDYLDYLDELEEKKNAV